MTVARQRTGRRAEDLVSRRLAARGWRIVERNARTRYGELDIVAIDTCVMQQTGSKPTETGSRCLNLARGLVP